MPVPSAQEVTQLLQNMGFDRPLELGAALDLPASELLSLIPWADQSRPLRHTLSAACPLELEQLARLLEQRPFHAPNVAHRVRQLEHQARQPVLQAHQEAVLEDLIQLLLPVAEHNRTLGRRLGLSTAQLDAVSQDTTTSPADVADSLNAVVEAACHRRHLTPENWLQALARGGGSADQLQAMADHWLWQGAPDDDREHQLEKFRDIPAVSAAVVARHQQDPNAPIPLSQAWLLMSGQTDSPCFPCLLDDASRLPQPESDERRAAVLLSLLRYAAEHENRGLPWSLLVRLNRFECLDESIRDMRPFDQDLRSRETVSRRLLPSDLVALAASSSAELIALQVAGLWGLGLDFDNLQTHFGHRHSTERGLEIWRRLYNRMPGLETGHLTQLLRGRGAESAVSRLVMDSESRMQPDVPLTLISPRSGAFVALCDQLNTTCNPGTFSEHLRDLTYGSYTPPERINVLYRWLHHLAQDSSARQHLLTQLRHIEQIEQIRAAQARRR